MDETQIRQKANRRAAFITHLVTTLLGVPALMLFWFSTIRKTQFENAAQHWGNAPGDTRVWTGADGRVGLLVAFMLLAFFVHLARYGNRVRAEKDSLLGEKWQAMTKILRRRRAIFTLHAGGALALLIGTYALMTDYQNYTFSSGTQYFSASNYNFPSAAVIPALILFFLVIPHAVWLMYRELSDRTVKHALSQQESEKQKNEVFATSDDSALNWQVGDDGELWEVSEQQQKRLAQE